MLLKRGIEISSVKRGYTSCKNGLYGKKLLLEFKLSYLQAGKS